MTEGMLNLFIEEKPFLMSDASNSSHDQLKALNNLYLSSLLEKKKLNFTPEHFSRMDNCNIYQFPTEDSFAQSCLVLNVGDLSRLTDALTVSALRILVANIIE